MKASRSWVLSADRLFVSAFLAFHIAATITWVMPACPIRERCLPAFTSYMLPLGLWQCWTMFAPDPMRQSVTLEADVTDAHGIRSRYAFLRLVDYSKWRGVPRFRHSKYTVNLLLPEMEQCRRFAARHAVRQLGLPAEAFPLDVRLVYQVREAPPPGGPPADPMAPTRPHALGAFHFTGIDEVLP